MLFNVNYSVRVRLTEVGRDALQRQHRLLNARFGTDDPYEAPCGLDVHFFFTEEDARRRLQEHKDRVGAK